MSNVKEFPQAPWWAVNQGEDEFGLWAEFEFKGITQRLRWIEPGSFFMGAPESESKHHNDEGPQHEVTLTQGFWMFDTAVTQALWVAVMGGNPSEFEGPDRPVENVSWHDANVFIRKVNDILPGLELSLPTEAQWEYACRAGTQTPFYFGDNVTPKQVNYNGNHPYNNSPKGLYRKETVVVKSLPPNAWGLYEMHGNVWEWCEDYWGYYSAEAQTDPTGPSSGGSRVFRGGSWLSHAPNVRAACRSNFVPGRRSSKLGFRCARVQHERKLAAQAQPRTQQGEENFSLWQEVIRTVPVSIEKAVDPMIIEKHLYEAKRRGDDIVVVKTTICGLMVFLSNSFLKKYSHSHEVKFMDDTLGEMWGYEYLQLGAGLLIPSGEHYRGICNIHRDIREVFEEFEQVAAVQHTEVTYSFYTGVSLSR